MSLHPALRECECGHVANHHGGNRRDGYWCNVAGCQCRGFTTRAVSIERHNEVVGEANRRIRALIAERDKLRARVRELTGA